MEVIVLVDTIRVGKEKILNSEETSGLGTPKLGGEVERGRCRAKLESNKVYSKNYKSTNSKRNKELQRVTHDSSHINSQPCPLALISPPGCQLGFQLSSGRRASSWE